MAVVKLVVNANPFQSGRLISTFIPAYRHLTTSEQAIRNVTLAQVTTQPNVELNIADSSSIMRIPYIAPTTYFDMKSGAVDWGTYFLRILSPLQTGSAGETSFRYDIFLHFENVELAGPINPESSFRATNSREYQAPRNNVNSLRKQETSQVSSNTASGTVSRIGHAADMIHGSILADIPGVAAATSLIGDVAAIGSSIMSIFGWSKPLVTSSTQPLMNRPFFQLQNSDSGAMCDTLSMTTNPLLPAADALYGEGKDEMSFAYLKTIHSLKASVDWATTDVATTALAQYDLTLTNLLTSNLKTGGTTATAYRTGSPMFIIAKNFSVFRGGIELTVKFVKTNFHSGRIAISFTPNLTGNFPTLDTSAYVLREIVDLKDSDSITLSIPFMQPVDYLSTEDTNLMSNSLGKLSIHVVTPLRAPETVAGNVPMLIYVKPGPDFEVAGPKLIGGNFAAFTPESGLSSTGDKVSKQLGNANSAASNLEVNALCFADPVLSLKQLLLQPTRFCVAGLSSASSNFRIYPFARTLVKHINNVLVNWNSAEKSFCFDPLTSYASAYAFERGSARILNTEVIAGGPTVFGTIVPRDGSSNFAMYADSGLDQSLGLTTFNSAVVSQRVAQINVVRHGVSGGLDFLAPHWGKTAIRLVRFQSPNDPHVDIDLPGSYDHDIFYYGRTLSPYDVFRSAGDDYTLGYFIGFPPMAYTIA